MNLYRVLAAFARALGRAAQKFWSDNRFNDCAAISYYALLSIVPLVGLVIGVLSLFVGVTSEEIGQILREGGWIVPEFGAVINAAVTELLRHGTSIGLVSLVTTVWFASLVFGSIQTAFDRIFQTFHPPLWGLMKPRLVALAAAVLLMLSFVFNILMTVVRSVEAPLAARVIDFVEGSAFLNLASSFVLDILVFMLILYTLPPRRLHDWRMVIPAALVGAIGWRAARSGFGIYLSYATTSLTFTGSAGAVVVFMLWIYYATLVLLYSAELLVALDRARQDSPAS